LAFLAALDFGFVPMTVTVSESFGTVILNATLLNGVIADGLKVTLRAFTDDSSPRTTASGSHSLNNCAIYRH